MCGRLPNSTLAASGAADAIVCGAHVDASGKRSVNERRKSENPHGLAYGLSGARGMSRLDQEGSGEQGCEREDVDESGAVHA
jgi:hypothetical protein